MLGESLMKLSASYVYEGKVVAIVKGETSAHVKLEVAPGNVLAASIPNEELDRMALRPGMTARASVRARQIQLPRH
jgi:molybdopterin-binding protein